MKIVAFGHENRQGKSTASKFLCSCIKSRFPGMKIQTSGFADIVKEVSYNMFFWAGLQPASYYENDSCGKFKDLPLGYLQKTPRDIWIHVGEEMRKLCPTLWVELLVNRLPKDTDLLIIYDLRKLPEANYILSNDGFCYEITGRASREGQSISELQDWNGWSGKIENTGTLRDLMQQIEILSRTIFNA
jgi:hypothetical protein